MPRKKKSKYKKWLIRALFFVVGIALVIKLWDILTPVVNQVLWVGGIVIVFLIVLGVLSPKNVGKELKEAIGFN